MCALMPLSLFACHSLTNFFLPDRIHIHIPIDFFDAAYLEKKLSWLAMHLLASTVIWCVSMPLFVLCELRTRHVFTFSARQKKEIIIKEIKLKEVSTRNRMDPNPVLQQSKLQWPKFAANHCQSFGTKHPQDATH